MKKMSKKSANEIDKLQEKSAINKLLIFCFFFSFISFLGKFGERQNKPQTHNIQSAARFYNLLSDPDYQMGSIRIFSDDVMEVVTS